MGTKRIGRVGERDAGFHSNGALPSALSCCHYGSEVFRSCRKQSYGKRKKKKKRKTEKSRLSWFRLCILSSSAACPPSSPAPLPDSICFVPADVMWSEPQRCGYRQCVSALVSPSFSLALFFFSLLSIFNISFLWKPGFSFFMYLHGHLFFFNLLKSIVWM